MLIRNTHHTEGSLLELTKPEGDCLIWQGTKRDNGYGVTVYKGVQTTTHRVMYQIVHNKILPNDMEVDHTCNNRDCINPLHLREVTHAENMRLSAERRTTCREGHEWTEENTYITEVKRKQGGTRMQRFCRECRKKAAQDFRDRKMGIVERIYESSKE